VPAVGDILRRFRFPGVPGAPAPVGVPVDRGAQLETELEPVFAALTAAQDRAREVVEAAGADAALRRAQSSEQVRRLLVRAREDADAARKETVAVQLARAHERRSELMAEAREEAERIRRVAAERAPRLVDEIVRQVLEMVRI